MSLSFVSLARYFCRRLIVSTMADKTQYSAYVARWNKSPRSRFLLLQAYNCCFASTTLLYMPSAVRISLYAHYRAQVSPLCRWWQYASVKGVCSTYFLLLVPLSERNNKELLFRFPSHPFRRDGPSYMLIILNTMLLSKISFIIFLSSVGVVFPNRETPSLGE